MPTFEIHIGGIVQGVGFRPYVFRLAKNHNIKGWIINGSQGVRIRFNSSDKTEAKRWQNSIINQAPSLARIDHSILLEVQDEVFQSFAINESSDSGITNTPITPDFATCSICTKELKDRKNRRYFYPFITCTNCGPRYSITRNIPYDRPYTVMDKFPMCDTCNEEYHAVSDRRYYSQTNSCPTCRIDISLNEKGEKISFSDDQNLIKYAVKSILKGKILAVKGIGGYLLMCDATSDRVVRKLRDRKNRPDKPFAIMYSDTSEIQKFFHLSEIERATINSEVAPILLLKPKNTFSGVESIAPGLDSIGVMRSYSPLLYLICNESAIPLVATSGNISGSPIIYEDETALSDLHKIADVFIINNREILTPQDDSVIKFTEKTERKIIIRRSRGLAPNYRTLPKYFEYIRNSLALGADMKGSFALVHENNLYISQYLGDLSKLHSQESFEKVLSHLQSALGFTTETIISDIHPGYYGHQRGREIDDRDKIELKFFQHHKAHFASVLVEHDKTDSDEKIMGVIWDGTGMSPEGNIWGSEIFIYRNRNFEHMENIGYARNISGDRMSKEPRISLLAFTNNAKFKNKYVDKLFSKRELEILEQVKENSKLKTSSMGRLFDAVSCLLTGITTVSFESQASMYLEVLAKRGMNKSKFTPELFKTHKMENVKPFEYFINQIYQGLEKGEDKDCLAYKFHLNLVSWIYGLAQKYRVDSIAFSGGVFQNSVLTDMINLGLNDKFKLYYNLDLSPNDENIAFGQLGLSMIEELEPEKHALR